MSTQNVDNIWKEISESVLNNIKIELLKTHVSVIIHYFAPRIDLVVGKYAKYLPRHVVDSEIDDLKTISKLEFLETLKVWDPNKGEDVWPLAQTRILGAMKDHIRYITKSDPSRFYEWVTDAAHVYNLVNDRADFSTEIENGIQLNMAMEELTYRERKIVIAHTQEDKTFKDIGERFGISESQTSRVYKAAIGKMRKKIEKGN